MCAARSTSDQFIRPTERVHEWSRTYCSNTGGYCVRRGRQHYKRGSVISLGWTLPPDTTHKTLSHGTSLPSLNQPQSSRVLSRSCADISNLGNGRHQTSYQYPGLHQPSLPSRPQSQCSANISIYSEYTLPSNHKTQPKTSTTLPKLINRRPWNLPARVETESLRQFYESLFTQVLVSPVPVSLYSKKAEANPTVLTSLWNRGPGDWVCTKRGLLTFLVCHDPTHPSMVNEVHVQVCDPFTYASLWIGTIALTKFPNRKLGTSQSTPNFAQQASTLYDTTQSNPEIFQHSFVCKITRNVALKQKKSVVKSKYSSTEIAEYQVYRLRFEMSRNRNAVKRQLDKMGSKVQQYLAKAMEHKWNQETEQKKKKGEKSGKRQAKEKANIDSSSISTPCLFRHVRSITAEQMKEMRSKYGLSV